MRRRGWPRPSPTVWRSSPTSTAFAMPTVSTRDRSPPAPGTATLLPEALDALTRTAALAGIDSLRAPRLAAAAARALARLDGRETVGDDDLRLAAELTLAHRATVSLAENEDDAPPPPDQTDAPDDRQSNDETQALPEDILLEAIRTALPADLLARLAAGRAARQARGATGTGATKRGNRRGRPLPARPGRLDGHARIDLVATLRAAAPWQTIRRKATGRDGLLELRAGDIRLKQAQERSDRLLIFTVDASGSSALARLAEAKGAVELLLAQAYARRDHVALVAFRGAGAEVLLPPTRSLVQTKRRLAALPGRRGHAHGLGPRRRDGTGPARARARDDAHGRPADRRSPERGAGWPTRPPAGRGGCRGDGAPDPRPRPARAGRRYRQPPDALACRRWPAGWTRPSSPCRAPTRAGSLPRCPAALGG